jgi:glucosamine-6-phosphate deaminase
MKKLIYDSYEEMSRAAADIVAEQLTDKPSSVLGLATGSTPIGMYEELARRYSEGKIDFSKAKSFNLDEYYPIEKTHPQSYNYFMNEHLFSKVNFAASFLPNGETKNPKAECADYDAKIEAAGGIDLQVLGIGVNGHIGFNEPSTTYFMNTNLTGLTESTLDANSRFFDNKEDQPTEALTLGFGAIFAAKKILLLINGAGKAEIAKKLFEGKIHTDIPASLLVLHPDVTVLMDKEAAGW